MHQPPLAHVAIKEPLPGTDSLAVIDEVNPNVTEVEIGTQAPGGYAHARVGLTLPDAVQPDIYPSLPEPCDLRDKAHVEITVGGLRVHEGIMQEFAVAQDGFESLGYGLAVGEFGSIETGGTQQGSALAILTEAIDAVPWWSVGSVAAFDAKRAWNDVRWQPSASVIESLTSEGDSVSPYTFLVYEHRLAQIKAVAPPSRAHYHIAYDRTIMDLRWDVSQTIDGARMVYTNPLGIEDTTDYLPASGVNLASDSHLRLRTLQGASSGGDLAQAFVAAYVAYYSQKILTGTITYSDWQGPNEVPGYAVRAGQWIKLGEYGMAMIMSTTSNLSTGVTALQVGPPPLATLAGVMRRADRTAIRLRRHVDPVTGVKQQGALPYDLMTLIMQIADAYFESARINRLPAFRR